MGTWEKRCKRVCAAALITAAVLRAAGSGTLAAAGARGAESLREQGFASFLLYLQTGRRIQRLPEKTEPPTGPQEMDTTAPSGTVPEETAPEETEQSTQAPAKRVFSPSEAEGLEVKYGGSYRPDLGELLAAPVNLNFSGEEPRILIISTHATEAYKMEPGWEYTPTSLARTTDTDYNVVRVAAELARVLEEGGISVIHDTSLNDYPSYNGAYGQAGERIAANLAEYPSIQMVIDVHRDAIADDNGNQLPTATWVQDQDTARVMLVIGTNEGGLEHPNWEDNLSWALKVQKILEEQSPGLARPLNLRAERFNQQCTPGSCLVEVGSSGDTLAQALTAVRLFGQALLEAIDGT